MRFFAFLIASFLICEAAQAEIFNFPSEEECKKQLKNVESTMSKALDISYCQSEKNGTQLYCMKTNGNVAFAECNGKTFIASGF